MNIYSLPSVYLAYLPSACSAPVLPVATRILAIVPATVSLSLSRPMRSALFIPVNRVQV
jgi:hypothetical protein